MSIVCPITVTLIEQNLRPNITAIANPMPLAGTIPYSTGLVLGTQFTWKNNGNAPGSFTPALIVNGQTVYSTAQSAGALTRTLDPGESITLTFTFAASTPGTYSICPSPN